MWTLSTDSGGKLWKIGKCAYKKNHFICTVIIKDGILILEHIKNCLPVQSVIVWEIVQLRRKICCVCGW